MNTIELRQQIVTWRRFWPGWPTLPSKNWWPTLPSKNLSKITNRCQSEAMELWDNKLDVGIAVRRSLPRSGRRQHIGVGRTIAIFVANQLTRYLTSFVAMKPQKIASLGRLSSKGYLYLCQRFCRKRSGFGTLLQVLILTIWFEGESRNAHNLSLRITSNCGFTYAIL